MGCHLVLNYKDKDFRKQFNQAGLIDVYFDNGELLLCDSRLEVALTKQLAAKCWTLS
jgi:NADPH-dependent curcumin reductase CurA